MKVTECKIWRSALEYVWETVKGILGFIVFVYNLPLIIFLGYYDKHFCGRSRCDKEADSKRGAHFIISTSIASTVIYAIPLIMKVGGIHI